MNPKKAWIVPKAKIKEFFNKAYCSDGNFHIDSVVPYDDRRFLVLTSGSYPWIENRLKQFIEDN